MPDLNAEFASCLGSSSGRDLASGPKGLFCEVGVVHAIIFCWITWLWCFVFLGFFAVTGLSIQTKLFACVLHVFKRSFLTRDL
jgi:hypothetical protein